MRAMITNEKVMDVLQEIPDPEMPISIVELGLIENVQIEADDDNAHVSIQIVPHICCIQQVVGWAARVKLIEEPERLLSIGQGGNGRLAARLFEQKFGEHLPLLIRIRFYTRVCHCRTWKEPGWPGQSLKKML